MDYKKYASSRRRANKLSYKGISRPRETGPPSKTPPYRVISMASGFGTLPRPLLKGIRSLIMAIMVFAFTLRSVVLILLQRSLKAKLKEEQINSGETGTDQFVPKNLHV